MKKLAILLLTLALSTNVLAKGDPVEDFQIWVPVNLNVKLGEQLRGFLEVQPRIVHNAESLDTGIVRPAIGWALNDKWTVWGGYLLQASRDSKSNEYQLENRSWQGLTYKTKVDNTTIEVRNRLEQRFLPHNGDISHRWRTRVRAEYVLPAYDRLSLIGSEELFINLNDNENDTQLQAGPAHNRAYIGVGYRFNPHAQIETGYLNQYALNWGEKVDGSNNVWMSNINLNF